MSIGPQTGRRTWVGATLAAILTGTALMLATDIPGTGKSFTLLQSPYKQDLYAATGTVPADGSILGGVAFAPDGRVWASECVFLGTRLHRFAAGTTTVHLSNVHPEDAVVPVLTPDGNPAGGCGIVNHPDGKIYSNSTAGLWALNASTGEYVAGPFGHPGNGLGIAVDPQSNHLVYVGDDCHPSLNPGGTTCTIWDFDPETSTSAVFANLPHAGDAFLDGIYFDPSGNFLFGAHRQQNVDDSGFITNHNALQIIPRPASLNPAGSQTSRLIAMQSEPDGVAFHATDGFVVTLNESLDCVNGSNELVASDPNTALCPDGTSELGGTMTRFDFPNGYLGTGVVMSTFAAGGFRGDLLQVGADGCIYGTQAPLYVNGGTIGVRYDDLYESSAQSIVQICGGFAPPPGVEPPAAGSLAGTVYADKNRNGVFDAGDTGIGGVTVTLETGGNTSTTTSLGDGTYSFNSLAAGSYQVSSPATADGRVLWTPSPLPWTLAAGENKTGLDFGYVDGSVAGVVYADLNKNFTRDGGEPGIPNVTVTLSGAANKTALTTATGSYSFSELVAGNYSVSSPPTASGLDLETTSPLAAALTPGQNRTGLDFGYVNGALSGVVFADLDKDGVRDSGEPPLGGVPVTLTGGPGGTTTSAANGSYSFSGLQAGVYDVTAPPTTGGLALSTLGTQATTLAVGGVKTDLDFGYITGSIAGFAYVDSNSNGVMDSGEARLSNVTISLSLAGIQSVVTTNTAADGSYLFNALIGGNYTDSAPPTAGNLTLRTPSPINVTLPPGFDQPNINFGYRAAAAYATYTQGGWGATPHGNNPGMILKNNWNTVYGANGVTIGGSPYYLKFTSQAAIEAFLPAGKTPGVLNKSATNPTSSSAGVFAGQVLALRLSMDFSAAGIITAGLSVQKIAPGYALAGYTLTQVMALANQVLAGNTSALPAGVTVAKLNDLISAINQNYDNGTTNNGVLVP